VFDYLVFVRNNHVFYVFACVCSRFLYQLRTCLSGPHVFSSFVYKTGHHPSSWSRFMHMQHVVALPNFASFQTPRKTATTAIMCNAYSTTQRFLAARFSHQ
jgi:hypothetical protein